MMRWTKKKPTVPGYYWHQHPLGRIPNIALVFMKDDGEWYVENPFPAASFTAKLSHKVWNNTDWAGPIPEPR